VPRDKINSIYKVNIGIYPASVTGLDYLANRYDALDGSTYTYWYNRSPLVKVAHAFMNNQLTQRAAERILRNYEDGEYAHLMLEDITGLVDHGVFSDCNDWLVFSSDFHDLIVEDWANDPLSNLFLPGADAIRFLAFYQPADNRILVTKSPHIEKREQSPPFSAGRGDTPPYSNAMVPGHALTFVLPGEAEAAIKQDMR
jgi:hypothetical protein